MSDVEESLNNFLVSLGETHRLLAGKASELMRRAEWSEVLLTLDEGEMNADRPDRYLAVSGYVDGQLRGVGGVVWYFEAQPNGNRLATWAEVASDPGQRR